MDLTLTRDVAEFAVAARSYLEDSHRPERNVLATTLRGIESGLYSDTEPLFAIARRTANAGELAGVAMRTPPWPALVAGVGGDPVQAADLVEAWLEHDPDVPGVSAVSQIAHNVAAAYTRLTNRPTRIAFREAMHALTEVMDPPRPAPGTMRRATAQDRDQLIAWDLAFLIETGISHDATEESVARRFDWRLERGLQFVWEAGRKPVSTVAFNPPVAGTTRIGPVYTPQQRRNRGYASAAVAALSGRLLDTPGIDRCMLFTDLANPTSNRIYASVGYVRFADWEEHRFETATPGVPGKPNS